MATYQDVKAKISKLEEQARALLQKESATVVAKIRGLMSEYGLTVQDLGLGITNMGKKMSAMKQPLPPKYQDPVSGKTWSGKGKAPGWIVEATKKGKRNDFLIGKAAAKPEAKKAATKKTITAKPVTKKSVPATKPAASKKAPAAKKVAVAKKAAPLKPAAKPVAKATAKLAAKPAAQKAVVAKRAAPKTKAAVTAPAATSAPKA
jgi:DNA-binding protein H-NS